MLDEKYISTLEAWNRASKKGDKKQMSKLARKIDNLENKIIQRSNRA